jgi:hypothetical protein
LLTFRTREEIHSKQIGDYADPTRQGQRCPGNTNPDGVYPGVYGEAAADTVDYTALSDFT